MSKAYAFVAALACFLPAVVACSSSNDTGTSSGNKKDSGSDSGSSGDDDGDDDGTTEDAGKADATAATCSAIKNGIALYAGKAVNPTKCKTCLADNCSDEIASCATSDLLTCGSSNCTTECAAKDSGTVTGVAEAGGGDGAAAGPNCTALATCCATASNYPLVGSNIGTLCNPAIQSNDEAQCKSTGDQVNQIAGSVLGGDGGVKICQVN